MLNEPWFRVDALEKAGWPLPAGETEESFAASLNGSELPELVWSKTAPASLVNAAECEMRERGERAFGPLSNPPPVRFAPAKGGGLFTAFQRARNPNTFDDKLREE